MMINDCSPHQVRFAEMRALSSATMALQAAARNDALVDRGVRRFARTQAQRAYHSWVSYVTNRALTQHTQVLAAQHASVQAAQRAMGRWSAEMGRWRAKPPPNDQPESSSAPAEQLPHGVAATSSSQVAACAPAARTQPPSSRSGSSALAPSPRGASCSTAGSPTGTAAMSEDAVRWMAAAATAAAALGDVVAQFGRYTGGDTARSSSEPDATPAPLSATQRAQFDRTCEREMPEWLRAAADAASLISDAAERLQYGSSHPASHPASRPGSRPSSRCAAEPASTPKGRIAIINDTVDPAVSPSQRQRLLEEAMVSAYESEGAADAQAISRNLRGSLYNELGKVPQEEVEEDEMSPNTLKTFERAAAATHMGPIAYEAGCSAMRAMEAVSAAMEALGSLAAQEEHEMAAIKQEATNRSKLAATAAEDVRSHIAQLEERSETRGLWDNGSAMDAAQMSVAAIAVAELVMEDVPDFHDHEGAAQSIAAECEALVLGVEMNLRLLYSSEEQRENCKDLSNDVISAVAACQLELVDLVKENTELNKAVADSAAAVAVMDCITDSYSAHLLASTSYSAAEVACNAFKGRQEAELYAYEEDEKAHHKELADGLAECYDQLVEYATGSPCPLDPREASSRLRTRQSVGEFEEEADKAIALEHRISVGYVEASSTAIEAMQMHEQADRDVAAERAAAEGTEARARAQAMVKAATQAHQRVIDVALAEQAALRQTHDEIEADEEELAAHLYPATSVDEKRQLEHRARMARLPGGLPPAHPAFDEAVDYFGGEMPALEAIFEDVDAPLRASAAPRGMHVTDTAPLKSRNWAMDSSNLELRVEGKRGLVTTADEAAAILRTQQLRETGAAGNMGNLSMLSKLAHMPPWVPTTMASQPGLPPWRSEPQFVAPSVTARAPSVTAREEAVGKPQQPPASLSTAAAVLGGGNRGVGAGFGGASVPARRSQVSAMTPLPFPCLDTPRSSAHQDDEPQPDMYADEDDGAELRSRAREAAARAMAMFAMPTLPTPQSMPTPQTRQRPPSPPSFGRQQVTSEEEHEPPWTSVEAHIYDQDSRSYVANAASMALVGSTAEMGARVHSADQQTEFYASERLQALGRRAGGMYDEDRLTSAELAREQAFALAQSASRTATMRSRVPPRVAHAFDLFDEPRRGILELRRLPAALEALDMSHSEPAVARELARYAGLSPLRPLDVGEFAELVQSIEGAVLRGSTSIEGELPPAVVPRVAAAPAAVPVVVAPRAILSPTTLLLALACLFLAWAGGYSSAPPTPQVVPASPRRGQLPREDFFLATKRKKL